MATVDRFCTTADPNLLVTFQRALPWYFCGDVSVDGAPAGHYRTEVANKKKANTRIQRSGIIVLSMAICLRHHQLQKYNTIHAGEEAITSSKSKFPGRRQAFYVSLSSVGCFVCMLPALIATNAKPFSDVGCVALHKIANFYHKHPVVPICIPVGDVPVDILLPTQRKTLPPKPLQ